VSYGWQAIAKVVRRSATRRSADKVGARRWTSPNVAAVATKASTGGEGDLRSRTFDYSSARNASVSLKS
jgi:hypothetical protein